jgi:hypothetical protein
MKPTDRNIEEVLRRSLPSASKEQVESARLEVYEYARSMAGTHSQPASREYGSNVEDFGESLSPLGVAIRERDCTHGQTQPFVASEPEPLLVTRWALVAAVFLLLGLAPFLAVYPVEESRQMSVSSAEALMDSVNGHLSRTIPGPMEPMMSLLPGDEVEIVWGGVQ